MTLKQILKKGANLAFVGAHNPFVAKLVEKTGFGGVYLSGAGLSNSLGVPDIGILTLKDFAYAAKFISKAVSLPLLADADTGFDDIEETVKVYIESGVSGMHIEDQLFPKRCGHLDGKEVVDAAEMEKKIRKAVKVRDSLNKDFLIMARTDARGAVNINEKNQFDEAVSRGHAYLKAGADAIFPESMRSVDEFKKYRSSVEGILLANMTEFGKTPFLTADEFAKLGYQITIFPVTVFRYLAGCAARGLETLKKEGCQKNMVKDMMSRGDINKVLGYDPSAGD